MGATGFAQNLYQPGTLATSFSAISSSGTPGTAFALPSSELSFFNLHSWQVIVSSQPTSITVKFEGSLDNANWFTLSTIASTDTGWVSGQGELVPLPSVPVRFIRCNPTQYTANGSTASCQFISGRQ